MSSMIAIRRSQKPKMPDETETGLLKNHSVRKTFVGFAIAALIAW